MKYEKQLLVFDWDGTLMDSQARIVNCFHAAIKDLGMESRSHEQLSNVIGLGFREALHTLYPDTDDNFHQELVERYRHYFLNADETPSVLFEGAMLMLEELNRQGYFLAIATGKGRQGLDIALKESSVAHLFHASRCADETRSKPHPQMLEELMDYFAVDSAHTVMIGDTEYDLKMANHANVHPVGVTYGVHSEDRIRACNPIACHASTQDLHSWLSNQISFKALN
ncbi:MAG: HAD-IA family hydrolase [Thioalkalispiraceae bacterium]|jgi:phosphoglycolate phosphatase